MFYINLLYLKYDKNNFSYIIHYMGNGIKTNTKRHKVMEDIIKNSKEYNECVQKLEKLKNINASNLSSSEYLNVAIKMNEFHKAVNRLKELVKDPKVRENSDPVNLMKLLLDAQEVSSNLVKSLKNRLNLSKNSIDEYEPLAKDADLFDNQNIDIDE